MFDFCFKKNENLKMIVNYLTSSEKQEIIEKLDTSKPENGRRGRPNWMQNLESTREEGGSQDLRNYVKFRICNGEEDGKYPSEFTYYAQLLESKSSMIEEPDKQFPGKFNYIINHEFLKKMSIFLKKAKGESLHFGMTRNQELFFSYEHSSKIYPRNESGQIEIKIPSSPIPENNTTQMEIESRS